MNIVKKIKEKHLDYKAPSKNEQANNKWGKSL